MIEFFLFLLVVCAAGFIYLLFQSRWQVKDSIATKINFEDDSIKIADKINVNGEVITGGTSSSANKIEFPKANEIISVVETVNYKDQLQKTPPRINQAHWQIRTFERPRRKVKR